MAIDKNSDAALEVSDKLKYMQYLKDEPIAEFAKYAGIALDEAVNRRVAAAVADAAMPPKMEITARPIEQQGNLYGFASVKIGGIRIDDFKIVADKDKKLFVGMPSKPDKSSNTGYRNTVFVDKDFKDDFNKAVLKAHYDAVEILMDKAEKIRPAPDKPERIAEQVVKAKKEAEKHNADLPKKESKAKTRKDRGE